MPCHRSSAITVEWHPYGEFFASGSADTYLKVWDMRQRACIQTYRGHAGAVRNLLFSPDGRWVVSGCDGGEVRLWDLTAGKLLTELRRITGGDATKAKQLSDLLFARTHAGEQRMIDASAKEESRKSEATDCWSPWHICSE